MKPIVLAPLLALFFALGPVRAGCPDAESMRARLAKVDPARAARTALFNQPVPAKLYAKALSAVGKPFSTRDGDTVSGVMVAPVAAAEIWRAINDEEHHAEGFLPVDFSVVVEGAPRGKDRVLFQYYTMAGAGRWWASRVRINPEVHAATEGAIWEIHWRDWMKQVDRTAPPVRDVAAHIRPIEASVGSWMVVPLGESCTLVEHYSESDPGGALGVFKAFVAAGAIRDTLEGIVEMAREHRCEPPASARFHGPDGKPVNTIDGPAGGR
jgi:hypothetical protein